MYLCSVTFVLQLFRVPVQVLAQNKIFGKESHAMHPIPESGVADISVDEQHDTNA